MAGMSEELKFIQDERYKSVAFESPLEKDTGYRHAAHTMVFAKQEKLMFLNDYKYPLKAAVMMQMRFDGTVGFPGGIIDPGESVIEGLNRELSEELGLDVSKYGCTMDDYISSHCCDLTKFVVHFFSKEVSLKEYEEIELKSLSTSDYGTEVQGTIRVPLYTIDEKGRGLPMFLKNYFIGNSKEQLLATLCKLGILSVDDIKAAVKLECTSS